MWILIDYSDVIVHVMTPKVRDYYGLEELWSRLDNSETEGRPHA
jgi:ribosome-associated protein